MYIAFESTIIPKCANFQRNEKINIFNCQIVKWKGELVLHRWLICEEGRLI